MTSRDIIEEAEIATLGSPDQIPQPVSFFAEVEAITMLIKYERIVDGFFDFSGTSIEYLQNEMGVPSPFSYIIFFMGTIVSLYLSTKITAVS